MAGRPDSPPMPPSTAPPRWYALPLLALGVLGFVAAWTLVALNYNRLFAWLALLAAADMVLLLGWVGRWTPGTSRALWAMLATALTIALANFCIVAGQVGRSMGLLPWNSALKLGPDYAWTLTLLANTRLDMACYALALVAAAWAGFSGRRRAP